MAKSMARVNGKSFKTRKLAILMKDSTNLTRKMVMAFSLGKVEMFTKAIIRMMSGMAMVRCIGLMDHSTLVNGRKVFSMG